MKLNRLRISGKLYGGFGIVLLVFLGVGIYVFSELSHSAGLAQKIENVIFQRNYYAVEMKQQSSDVWQWLTDISATHEESGFDEVAQHVEKFQEAYKEIKKLYPVDSREYSQLVAIGESFDKFYAVGKKMAYAYINEGVEGGNKMMEEFDVVGGDISARLDELKKDSIVKLKNSLEKIAGDLNMVKELNTISLVVAMIIGIVIAFLITRGILGPLEKMIAMLKDIAEGEGDLTKRITVSTHDELADLAGWFNKFLGNLNGIIANISASAETVASSSEEMTASTDEVSRAITGVAETAQEISTGASEQKSSIENINTRMAQLNSAAEEIASSAQTTADLANNVSENADEGGKALTLTVNKIMEIKESSATATETINQLNQEAKKIGNIVNTITTIAEQTNLLALNAAIEAARAGEQGRGFAVVADEVRKLAESSATAAGEITNLINGIQSATENAVAVMDAGNEKVAEGVEAVNQAGTSLGKIIQLVQQVNGSIQDISAAAEEQAASFTEVTTSMENITTAAEQSASGIENISANTQQTSASVQEIAASSQSLNVLSQSLQEIVGKFKIDATQSTGLKEV